ncbi:MAG: DMT family transporter [Alcaligenaceae bacterium]|nr:DMT family transporter [Alcaligenaceae bacterium]
MSNYKIFLGIALSVLSTWALSTQEASGKWLMQISLPLFCLVFFRYAVHVVLVLAITLPEKGVTIFRSKSYKMQVIRGLTTLVTTLAIFTALSYLPQAEATAIYFLAPLLVLCVAPWFLGEASRWHRWLAAVVGFMGVLVIVRPGAGLDSVGVAYALLAAVTIAMQFVYTKKLAADDSQTTLLWTGVVGLLVGIVLLPFQWHESIAALSQFGLWQWLLIINVGLFGALGHLLQIKAYQHAPASLLAPFSYFQIIAAATLGFVIWGDFPDFWAWVGISIVCGSGIVVTAVEWRHNRQVLRLVEKIIETK